MRGVVKHREADGSIFGCWKSRMRVQMGATSLRSRIEVIRGCCLIIVPSAQLQQSLRPATGGLGVRRR